MQHVKIHLRKAWATKMHIKEGLPGFDRFVHLYDSGFKLGSDSRGGSDFSLQENSVL